MKIRRKTTVPFPDLVEPYLVAEDNPEVRLRLALINLIGKLDWQLTLDAICDLLNVPVPTANVWLRAWTEEGYPGIVHPCRTTEGPSGRPPTLAATGLDHGFGHGTS